MQEKISTHTFILTVDKKTVDRAKYEPEVFKMIQQEMFLGGFISSDVHPVADGLYAIFKESD